MPNPIGTRALDDKSGTSAPVSVVIPCFRNAHTIGRAVASVKSQTWQPQEIVVVDDASNDAATELALTRLTNISGLRIRVVHLDENSGPSTARNTGWDLATQPYVAFLDADDEWHPLKLELQLPELLADPSLSMSAHIYGDFDPAATLPVRESSYELGLRTMLLRNRISTPTVVVQRAISQRFDVAVRFSEDYDLWLRIISGGGRCLFVPATLARGFKRPYGESGLSSNLREMERGQIGVYRRLRASKVVSLPAYLLLRSWSLAKYWRRLVISRLNAH